MEELGRYAIPIIACWGAVISTVLAAIKIWKTIRDRARIVINTRFSRCREIGNTVAIHNKSSDSLIITFWGIYQKRGIWPFSKRFDLEMQEHDAGNMTIRAHSEGELNFSGSNYFSTSRKNSVRGSVYMSLYISGRKRAITFCIYRFGR